MRLESAIEGWIIETSILGSRELWIVRGYRHPGGCVIVSPYIIGGRRVKQYEWHSIPSWLTSYIPCIGRTAPLIDERMITRLYDPGGALRVRRNDVPPEILELIDLLSVEWVGLTGSWAVVGESVSSDVDLLVYGNGRAIYEALSDLRDEGKILPCRVYERYSKVADKMSLTTYARLASLKVLDSCYKGIPYTIRILKILDRESCSDLIVKTGAYRGVIRIIEAPEPFSTPARYIIDINGTRVTMETWHTRYMELPKGFYRGYIELFHAREGIIASPDIVGYLEGPL